MSEVMICFLCIVTTQRRLTTLNVSPPPKKKKQIIKKPIHTVNSGLSLLILLVSPFYSPFLLYRKHYIILLREMLLLLGYHQLTP